MLNIGHRSSSFHPFPANLRLPLLQHHGKALSGTRFWHFRSLLLIESHGVVFHIGLQLRKRMWLELLMHVLILPVARP